MTRSCDNCGGHVSRDFWRVFSYEGELYQCINCTSANDLLSGPADASPGGISTDTDV